MSPPQYIDFDRLYVAMLQTALEFELRETDRQTNNVGQPIVDPAVVRRSFDLAEAMWAEAEQRMKRETQVA